MGEVIEERIVTGHYLPGTRLDEQELATSFGVSRTPVREALIQLASAGLLESRPRRGMVVPEIGLDRVCEMFEVMAELESMCGRLAARRITSAEHTALNGAHLACRSARDDNKPDLYYQLNEVFHQHIYNTSHNAFLREQAENLHRRLRPYRRLQLRVRNRMFDSFEEHQAIVDALGKGDSKLAESLLRSHILIQGERFTDLASTMRNMGNSVNQKK